MKRPSFQFYPGDWMRSTDLRCCSVGARGLWIDMICLMHEGRPYGHLKVGEKVILPANLASITGATLSDVEGWLHELTQTGVCSVGDDGCIFSRRMIRDEELRQVRAAGGSKGGNPALLGKRDGETRLTSEDKQNTTPSSASALASSSASASSVSKEKAPAKPKRTDYPEEFEAVWTEYPKRPGANKGDSLKAWQARIKKGSTPDEILAGVKAYAAYCKHRKTDPEFIKQPETFFGAGEHYKSDWSITAAPSRHGDFDQRDYHAGADEDGKF